MDKIRLIINCMRVRVYFEMFRFCRITDRSSLRISRNENGARLRLIFVRDDDKEDVVLLDEVEDLAVRSFDPEMSMALDCLSPVSSSRASVDQEGFLLSTSSQSSVADDVEADRIGILPSAFDLCVSLPLKNITFDSDEWASGFSSVGLLVELLSVLSEPIIIFECFLCFCELSKKPEKMEFCSFAMDSVELELTLTAGISSKSLDFGRFGD